MKFCKGAGEFKVVDSSGERVEPCLGCPDCRPCPSGTADCFHDGPHIRPLKGANALVWTYFNVLGEPPGALEPRRFLPCPCGCLWLKASPSVGKDTGPSFLPKPPPEPAKETFAQAFVREVRERFGDLDAPGNDSSALDPNGDMLVQWARKFEAGR